MADPHPTDRRLVALVDGRLDEVEAAIVRRHVEDCRLCQLRIGQVELTAAVDIPATAMTFAPVIAAEAIFEDREAMPAYGDVWRLVWDDVNELGVVDRVDADRRRVFVMPVLADVEGADDWCGVTALQILSDAYDVAVSVALEASVPWSVLDARIGHVGEMDRLTELRSRFKQGIEPDEKLAPIGMPVFSAFDPRLESIGELNDAFHVLAEATWGVATEAAAVGDIAAPLSFDELLGAGIEMSRALDLVRGDARLTSEEGSLLGSAGADNVVSGTPIPLELRTLIDQPRRRPQLRARMRDSHRREADERAALAAQAMQPIAARGTDGKRPSWDEILDRVLG